MQLLLNSNFILVYDASLLLKDFLFLANLLLRVLNAVSLLLLRFHQGPDILLLDYEKLLFASDDFTKLAGLLLRLLEYVQRCFKLLVLHVQSSRCIRKERQCNIQKALHKRRVHHGRLFHSSATSLDNVCDHFFKQLGIAFIHFLVRLQMLFLDEEIVHSLAERRTEGPTLLFFSHEGRLATETLLDERVSAVVLRYHQPQVLLYQTSSYRDEVNLIQLGPFVER